MSHISRYVIWVHRSPQSLFGGASNPVIRNGSPSFLRRRASPRRVRPAKCPLRQSPRSLHSAVCRQSLLQPRIPTVEEWGAWSRLRLSMDCSGRYQTLVSQIAARNSACSHGRHERSLNSRTGYLSTNPRKRTLRRILIARTHFWYGRAISACACQGALL